MNNDSIVTIDWTKTTVEEQIETLLKKVLVMDNILTDMMINKAEKELSL